VRNKNNNATGVKLIFTEGKIFKWFKLFCSWSWARKCCARTQPRNCRSVARGRKEMMKTGT